MSDAVLDLYRSWNGPHNEQFFAAVAEAEKEDGRPAEPQRLHVAAPEPVLEWPEGTSPTGG